MNRIEGESASGLAMCCLCGGTIVSGEFSTVLSSLLFTNMASAVALSHVRTDSPQAGAVFSYQCDKGASSFGHLPRGVSCIVYVANRLEGVLVMVKSSFTAWPACGGCTLPPHEFGTPSTII